MKFSLISDMHVDYPQLKTPYDLLEKTVVVAGDTANGLEGLKFLQKLRNKGFNVVAVDGNHEHYANASQQRDVEETTARFREAFPSLVVDAETGTPFVCRNGWYPVSDHSTWYKSMNDSRKCNLDSSEVNRRAKRDAEIIEQVLWDWRNLQIKGIVVTHTAPCEETLNPAYDGDPSNEYYWNPFMRPLLSEFSDVILVWCHGHTHAKNEAIVDGTRVICNPRGYPGENPDWAPLTVEV